MLKAFVNTFCPRCNGQLKVIKVSANPKRIIRKCTGRCASVWGKEEGAAPFVQIPRPALFRYGVI